jgi:rSAM/selenodomain-associated transferase 1
MTVPESTSTRILVFARAPVAGAVKTRLIPRLGAQGAAQLHEQLLRHTLAQACAAYPGAVTLCCTPDTSHPFFAQCAEEFALSLLPQSAGDLGDRMHVALAQTLQSAARVLLIGSDCPVFTPAILQEAATALTADKDLVFVPAEDGGYILIGARRIDPVIFRGVNWGTGGVMQQTRERMLALAWKWRELPRLWDVDRPDDLDRLAASGFALPQAMGQA